MLLHLVRILFLLVVLATTMSFALSEDVYGYGKGAATEYVTLYILIPAAAAVAVIFLDMFWRQKRLQALAGLFFGLLAGLAIAFILTTVIDLAASILPGPPETTAPIGPRPEVPKPQEQPDEEKRAAEQRKANAWDGQMDGYKAHMRHVKTVQLVKLVIGAAIVFGCVSFVLQTKDDFRFVIPYVEFSRQTKGSRPFLLDTSVIIDGRIADICETRIMESEMVVPRFILAELQAIADSDDKLKRNRGRRGLDVLNKLRSSEKIDIKILDAQVTSVAEAGDVDAKLVALAQHLGGRVFTNDYNLNKIAQLRDVVVININHQAGRGSRPGRGVPRRRDHGRRRAGTRLHRPRDRHRRHQRLADLRGTDDLRTPGCRQDLRRPRKEALTSAISACSGICPGGAGSRPEPGLGRPGARPISEGVGRWPRFRWPRK